MVECSKRGCTNDAFVELDGVPFCKKHGNISSTPNEIILPSQQTNHYDIGGIATFDILKAKQTKEGFEGFLEGNVIKYTMRHREKGGINDLIKALDYLQLLIKSKQGE